MGIDQPPESRTPFSGLDSLHTQILSETVVDRPHVFELLAIQLPIYTIEKLLEWQSNEISLALRGLRSLLGEDYHGRKGPAWIKVD
jgi:hypothetical protein